MVDGLRSPADSAELLGQHQLHPKRPQRIARRMRGRPASRRVAFERRQVADGQMRKGGGASRLCHES
jgi:hypothetical protein